MGELVTLDDAIQATVAGAVNQALAPYLRRLADPEPLVYSVPATAKVLCTSQDTVRRLIAEGVLPTVPHMGKRVVIPRWAVHQLVDSARPAGAAGPDAAAVSEPAAAVSGPTTQAGRLRVVARGAGS